MRLGMIRVTTTTSPDPGYLDTRRRIEHQAVVFLDDISCVSFIYGEQSVVRFVRAVQRMSRARGVVVRERVFLLRQRRRRRMVAVAREAAVGGVDDGGVDAARRRCARERCELFVRDDAFQAE